MESKKHFKETPGGKRLQRLTLQLDYEFDENPEWHTKPINISAYVDYISSFLSWYHSLEESLVNDILKSGIFDQFQNEFVYKMCIEEGEGEQSREEVEAVGRRRAAHIPDRDANLMNDPKERITFNMYRALEVAKSKDGAHKNDFHVTVQLLDEWHRILLENVPAAKPGICRSHSSDKAGAASHWYPAGDELEPALNRFIDQFCEMISDARKPPIMDDLSISNKDIVDIVKLVAWTLLTLLALHPYTDGNGRLCRLLCNYALSAIFPFDIPICNVYNKFTSRWDYLRALIKGQNCRCNDGQDGVECLKAEEIFEKANPSSLATMVLESCVFTCREFHKQVEQKFKEKVPEFTAHSPIPEDAAVEVSPDKWTTSF